MKKLPLYIAAALALCSCSGGEKWSLRGEAPDGLGEETTAYLEAPTAMGTWTVTDSVAVIPGKSFTLSGPRAARGTLMRLRIGQSTVYVPLDSTENLTLAADLSLAGSPEAELISKVSSIINDPAGTDTRRALLTALEGNYATTAAYYAARLTGSPRIVRTVANRFNEELPGDPRTAVLLADLRRLSPRPAAPDSVMEQVIYAPEIGYFDFELMDRNGRMRKLSETVGANPLTVLAYVDLANSEAPGITRALGDARNAGAEVFEVGFEANQHLWAAATEGLPWVNVYQSEAADDTHMGQYRVVDLPTFFLIKNGEIVERIADPAELVNTVNRYK